MIKRFCMLAVCFSAVGNAKSELELLHWWTSNGEREALATLESTFEPHSVKLNEEAIFGGGGGPAKAILQARAIAGTPPDIAQLEGPSIQSWAALGFLHQLTPIADNHEWDRVVYQDIQTIHKFEGEYVAIPINIHRLNWMWVNTSVLDVHNQTIPQDWDSLIQTLTELKSKGVAPVALGNEQWQIVQLFENIAFGVGGEKYYQRAFVELDLEALESKTTVESLNRFRIIASLIGNELPKLTWDEATDALLEGSYAFQFTGDWALGEILTSYQRMPKNIECVPFPSTENGFIYNVDSFAFFHTRDGIESDINSAAMAIASKGFLHEFNQKKGSIPAQKDIPIDSFSRCQKKSYHDLNQAFKNNTAIPSFVDSMAVNPTIQNAVSKELYHYFLDSTISADSLINRLKAIRLDRRG